MLKLRLENSLDVIDLDEQAATGTGVQALTGLSGLGLPPVTAQWVQGAGDGATYRGKRVLERDIDLKLDIVGRDRAHLLSVLSRLSVMLSDECTLVVADGTEDWSTKVVRVGGGDYVHGVDSIGTLDFQTVVTLRAGDPYFTSSLVSMKTITSGAGGTSLLTNLSAMPVSASQAMGDITLENTGDARTYPVWKVYGPGNNFKAVSPSGETLYWKGTLAAGEVLTIDAKRGTVVDATGANRYADLDTAPRFWSVPPGTSTVTASLLGVTSASKIECSWRARKWMVV